MTRPRPGQRVRVTLDATYDGTYHDAQGKPSLARVMLTTAVDVNDAVTGAVYVRAPLTDVELVDDPNADPTYTVRRSAIGTLMVKIGRDRWRNVNTGTTTVNLGVRGWPIIGTLPHAVTTDEEDS